ncbi:5-methylthioadenosine/S-adenosylhomocysteine deaminase [Geoalkalibacter ferrihydriticus]|uniref:5-methylthioadenosine/S-adenosylhomocysteine deaminase n=1 Tax=Geoalkalibacter ferrihydriticus TaxID=392333 RepID=A0A1G9MKD5_9BACT|nr:amidohydrolase [Geoalkalibacter ferrihydriticus]SDL74367.1 5-methylthioadenosine/S-adenosylhomocysteine deaminase [Geoalkalibacter ferrihydriticus]
MIKFGRQKMQSHKRLNFMSAALGVLLLLCIQSVSFGSTNQVDLKIDHALIVTMDAGMTIVEDGSVVIDHGEIVAVGPSTILKKRYNAIRSINAAGKLVMPGLVNTHTHAAMTLFRGLADDLPLDAWLTKHIWPAEAKFITAESVRSGANLALAEMVRSGTTTFSDMYFYADELAMAANKAGVRAVVGEAIIDFPTADSQSPAESFATIKELAAKWKNDPLITISVAPHSPYTCSSETLKSAKKLADDLGLPLTIHVSETQKEVSDITKQYGMPPFEYLDSLGFFGGTVIAAHAVYPTSSEIMLMAKKKIGVAHCAVSNMKLASGVAPIQEMFNAGVAVGLGTDGAASNNNLSMFKEMNTATLLQKVSRLEPTAMSARETVKAATIGGAQVLGLDNLIGSLETGKRADLIIIDLNSPHLIPLYNVYSQLVYATNGADVETVIIDGNVVMQDRKLLTLDEEVVMQEARKLALKIAEGEE